MLFNRARRHKCYTQTETFDFTTKKGSHRARSVFSVSPFESTKHKVFIRRDNETIVDGRPAFGTDGNIPSREITAIKFYIDREDIRIPRRFYTDCFEPFFGRHFSFDLSGDGATAIIWMHGSDAAFSYTVKWLFKKNGRHKRDAYQDFSPENL